MAVRISMPDAGGKAALSSLHDWLRSDPRTRNMSFTPVTPDAHAGRMATLEALDFALSNGTNLSALGMTIAAFLMQRRQSEARREPPSVRIEHGATAVTLTDPSAAQVERVLAQLRDAEAGTPPVRARAETDGPEGNRLPPGGIGDLS